MPTGAGLSRLAPRGISNGRIDLMAITAGARLGRIRSFPCSGWAGWGRCGARDTRLDREVAIKILPADFAADAGLRLRFDREA